MQFQLTTATKRLSTLNKRITAVCGGTAAGKTISILTLIIDYAWIAKNLLISVVSESFPHLKRGAIRDFKNIMEAHGYWQPSRWNKSDYTYTFATGTKVEFFSADQPGKVRGPRRDILFINEANNIPLETYNQLEVRTRRKIWLDWNPVSEFWWYTDVAPHVDHDFITLTYRDNEGLEKEIVDSIESRRHNKQWFRVYGEGKLGEVEGRIYKGWQMVDSVPADARLECYGLDFGYSNDPTAIVAVYKYNDGIILNEILYKKAMLNSEIASVMKEHKDEVIIADSAEPKSIDELRVHGLSVVPSTKGQGSVNQGIQSVQNRKISITKDSLNLIKEYRNYLWDKDKDEKMINKPQQFLDHLMDATRYAITYLYPLEDPKPKKKKERIPGTYVKTFEEYTNKTDDSFYADYNMEDAF